LLPELEPLRFEALLLGWDGLLLGCCAGFPLGFWDGFVEGLLLGCDGLVPPPCPGLLP
jgi:hypothetical protein